MAAQIPAIIAALARRVSPAGPADQIASAHRPEVAIAPSAAIRTA
jgi:hypothetical protein